MAHGDSNKRDAMDIEERIKKDIQMFDASIRELGPANGAGKKAESVVGMAKLYRADAQSYLEKGDFYTSFSCISYAHGLLDAIKELYGA